MNLESFYALCEKATERPWRTEKQICEGLPPVHRLTTDEAEPWIVAEVAYDCQSRHDLDEGQEDAANARLLVLAANNLKDAVEMLQDCARLLKVEGNSYHVEVEELLAKIEQESKP